MSPCANVVASLGRCLSNFVTSYHVLKDIFTAHIISWQVVMDGKATEISLASVLQVKPYVLTKGLPNCGPQ